MATSPPSSGSGRRAGPHIVLVGMMGAGKTTVGTRLARRDRGRDCHAGRRLIIVPVDRGDRSYDVLVGEGARHRLLEVLPIGVNRAVVVTQASIPVEVDPGVEHIVLTIEEGEEAKCLE